MPTHQDRPGSVAKEPWNGRIIPRPHDWLREYRGDRATFLGARKARKRCEGGAQWSSWRKLEGEAFHGAVYARMMLGLSARNPDRGIIP